VYPLTEPPTLKKQEKHDIEVVVDRLTVKASAKQRLTDSVETALNLADGIVVLEFVDREDDHPHREQRFSEKLACPNGHPLAVDDLEPRSFSFNSPYGACPECTGLGIRKEVDPELVVPDPDLTLAEGAIAPWSMGQSLILNLFSNWHVSQSILTSFSLDSHAVSPTAPVSIPPSCPSTAIRTWLVPDQQHKAIAHSITLWW
jgi:excinuclease UvrABC ATPase subunit